MTAPTLPGLRGAGAQVASSERAGEAALPRLPGAGDHHQAWLRAMEQAQLGAWFGHGGPTVAASAAGRPEPAATGAASAPRLPASPTTSALRPNARPEADPLPHRASAGRAQLAPTQGSRGDELAVSPPPVSMFPSPGGGSIPFSERGAVHRTSASLAEVPDPLARAPQQPTPSREPVRVHAEWSEEGLRLWLGVDQELSSLRDLPEPLVAELRRQVDATGGRLVSVVCNGRQLWASGPPPSRSTDARIDAAGRQLSSPRHSDVANPDNLPEETP